MDETWTVHTIVTWFKNNYGVDQVDCDDQMGCYGSLNLLYSVVHFFDTVIFSSDPDTYVHEKRNRVQKL